MSSSDLLINNKFICCLSKNKTSETASKYFDTQTVSTENDVYHCLRTLLSILIMQIQEWLSGSFGYQRCVWSTGTDLLLHSCQEQCSSSVIPCITFFESWSACQWIERTHQCLLIFHHFLYMNKDNTLPLQENMKNGYHSQWKLKQTSTYENSSAISEILQYSKIIWMLALSSKGKWTSWAYKAPKFISWVNELYQSLW